MADLWKCEFYSLGKAHHIIESNCVRGVLLAKDNDAKRIAFMLNEHATLKRKNEGLRQWLLVVLDCADYTAGNCRVNEMVGAVLPKEVIEQAREALLADTQEQDELEEALCFECTESIARCECPDGFYTGVDDGQTNVTV